MFARTIRLSFALLAAPLAACEEVPSAEAPAFEAVPAGLILSTTFEWAPAIHAVRFGVEAVPCGDEAPIPWATEAVLELRPGHGPADGSSEAEVFVEVPSAGCFAARAEVLGKDGLSAEGCKARPAATELGGEEPVELALDSGC